VLALLACKRDESIWWLPNYLLCLMLHCLLKQWVTFLLKL